MDVVAYITSAVLFLLGLVHLSWGLGSTWPCRDETTLARTVVGSRGIEKMPPKFASFFVAFCLFGAGLWALALRDIGPIELPRLIVLLGGAALTAIFGLRGIFGILPAFEKLAPEQPFLRLNRRIYSPLCFLIGLGFALLVLAVPNWSWQLSR